MYDNRAEEVTIIEWSKVDEIRFDYVSELMLARTMLVAITSGYVDVKRFLKTFLFPSSMVCFLERLFTSFGRPFLVMLFFFCLNRRYKTMETFVKNSDSTRI